MSDANTTVAVRLTLAVDSDPIMGVVTVGDGAPRDFMTWLELIAALDEARGTDRGDDR